MAEFNIWLEGELNKRGWKPIDLSKASGVDSGLVSRVLNGERSAGPETCVSFARALHLPPEYVFRQAGLLPPIEGQDPPDPIVHELVELYKRLPERDQAEVLEIVRMKWARASIQSIAEEFMKELDALSDEEQAEFVRDARKSLKRRMSGGME